MVAPKSVLFGLQGCFGVDVGQHIWRPDRDRPQWPVPDLLSDSNSVALGPRELYADPLDLLSRCRSYLRSTQSVVEQPSSGDKSDDELDEHQKILIKCNRNNSSPMNDPNDVEDRDQPEDTGDNTVADADVADAAAQNRLSQTNAATPVDGWPTATAASWFDS